MVLGMKGSIKQRTFTDAKGRTKKCATWSVRYSPPLRVGEPREFQIKSGFKTKREAEQWFDSKKAEFAQGIVTDGRQTLEAYLKEWLSGLRRQSSTTGRPSGSTLHAYSNHVEQHIIPAIGSVKLAELSARTIEDALYTWRTSSLQRRKKKNAGNLSERTVGHIFGTLRAALRKAHKQRVLAFNPCEQVAPPQPRKKKVAWLDAEAAESLLTKVSNDPAVGAAVTMALGTGLRRGELVALRREDIDLASGAVTVRHSLEREKGKSRLKETKGESLRKKSSADDEVTLPMPDFVIQRLRRHFKEQKHRFAEARLGTVTPETPVFDYAGGHWIPNTFGSAWNRALKKAGVTHLRLHDLRHSFGGILRDRGTDLKTIQLLLRHRDWKTTANLYLHNSSKLNREAVASLDLALNGNGSKRKAKVIGRVYSPCTVRRKTAKLSQ